VSRDPDHAPFRDYLSSAGWDLLPLSYRPSSTFLTRPTPITKIWEAVQNVYIGAGELSMLCRYPSCMGWDHPTALARWRLWRPYFSTLPSWFQLSFHPLFKWFPVWQSDSCPRFLAARAQNLLRRACLPMTDASCPLFHPCVISSRKPPRARTNCRISFCGKIGRRRRRLLMLRRASQLISGRITADDLAG